VQDVIATWACAMDIQSPYNLSRLIYFATEGDTRSIAELAKEADKEGIAGVSKAIMDKIRTVVGNVRKFFF